MTGALMPRAAIDEIVAHRNAALAGFAEAARILADAVGHARAACPSQPHYGLHTPTLTMEASQRRSWRHDELLTQATRELDAAIWRHLMATLSFDQLMDAEARTALRDQLAENPPEVTVETALATMGQLYEDRGIIFRRGVANAFAALDGRFKSHDGFKIGSRIVLAHAFTEGPLGGYWNHYQHRDEQLIDIERAFYVMDGRPAPAHREEDETGGIVGQVTAARRAQPFGAASYTASTEMFELRVFKNGNAHLWFKRDDLVRQVNMLLAEHYGAAIGAGHAARHAA